MRLVKFIIIGFGLFFGIILSGIYIGIPTIQDRYLEQETKQSTFTAFADSLAKCEITLIPEVLDRLIIKANFEHLNDGQEIIKDFDIKISADNKEQEKIFDVRLTKFNEPTMSFDEKLINDFNELPLNSEYRNFSFTIQPQYKLDQNDKFNLNLKVVLADTVTNNERIIKRTFTVNNDKEFRLEKFRGH